MSNQGSIFLGALLVAGTTIGGGMLGLPVVTGEAGFLPSALLYIICWAFMSATGLLFLEACLWMRGDTNVVSLARHTLGWPGKVYSWVLYLFLFYSLTLAYVVGSGEFMVEFAGGKIPNWVGSLLYCLVFGGVVFVGARLTGRVNMGLVAGLAVSYLGFIFLGYSEIDAHHLNRTNWSATFNALPIIFASFGFQGLVPTLTRYMGYSATRTRYSIIIGSLMSLATFLTWQWLVLGIVPYGGEHGLADALKQGNTAVVPLGHFIQNPQIYQLVRWFSFFALTTSFLGVVLGLRDFLADGLNIKKTALGRLGLMTLILVPTLLLGQVYPGLFLTALRVAGGFGVALLLGLLPVLIVWAGRYYHKFEGERPLPVGKTTLSLMALFVLLEVALEISRAFS